MSPNFRYPPATPFFSEPVTYWEHKKMAPFVISELNHSYIIHEHHHIQGYKWYHSFSNMVEMSHISYMNVFPDYQSSRSDCKQRIVHGLKKADSTSCGSPLPFWGRPNREYLANICILKHGATNQAAYSILWLSQSAKIFRYPFRIAGYHPTPKPAIRL